MPARYTQYHEGDGEGFDVVGLCTYWKRGHWLLHHHMHEAGLLSLCVCVGGGAIWCFGEKAREFVNVEMKRLEQGFLTSSTC